MLALHDEENFHDPTDRRAAIIAGEKGAPFDWKHRPVFPAVFLFAYVCVTARLDLNANTVRLEFMPAIGSDVPIAQPGRRGRYVCPSQSDRRR